MAVKKLRPTTPGQRYRIAPVFDNITESTPEKSLVKSMKSKGGRNNQGRMTVRNVGGGHKKKYREIDFKREKLNIPATVKSIEYDPNRTARIALLFNSLGRRSWPSPSINPNGPKRLNSSISSHFPLPRNRASTPVYFALTKIKPNVPFNKIAEKSVIVNFK